LQFGAGSPHKKTVQAACEKTENLSTGKKTATKRKLSQARKMQTIVKRKKIELSATATSPTFQMVLFQIILKITSLLAFYATDYFPKTLRERNGSNVPIALNGATKCVLQALKKKVFLRLLSWP